MDRIKLWEEGQKAIRRRLLLKIKSDPKRFSKYKERKKIASRAYREKQENKLKLEARRKVFINIRNGKLTKLPCVHCGSKESEAHHKDYKKPLEVEWVCHRCHFEKEHQPRVSVVGDKYVVGLS